MKLLYLAITALLSVPTNAFGADVDCAQNLGVASYFSTHTENTTGRTFSCMIEITSIDSGGNFFGHFRCPGGQDAVRGTLHGSNFFMERRYGNQLLRQHWSGRCTDQSVEGRYTNIESPGNESGPFSIHY